MKARAILLILCSLITASLSAQTLRMGAERTEILLPLLQQKRVALVVNPTSVVGPQKVHLLDTLLALKVNIKKVLAPEHGFRGKADAGEVIRNGKDVRTGLPILSLYGKNKKPSPQQLTDVDVVLFDIQDVGARFYTYISTLHYVMEACAEQGKQVIVADRPNPCDTIDGPIREASLKSFVGMDPIPVLHGCTMGELAQMMNGEGWLKNGVACKLIVIPMEGWKHGQPYLLPIKPSPNLPNDQSIALYASLCPFEGTAVSVGRGTYHPFQVYGSPVLPNRGYYFIPKPLPGFDKNPLYKGTRCYGKDLRKAITPRGFSLQYVIEAYQNYCKQGKGELFFQRANWFDLLVGTRTVRQQILQGKDEKFIRAQWQKGLKAFKEKRKPYVLYPYR